MIAFSDRQWEKVISNYRLWWQNRLGRPILPCVFWGRDPGRSMPKNPSLAFGNVADFSVTPEQIIDRMDYDLSCMEFYGDAYPYVNTTQFGPGILAAFLGADLVSTENTVWFHPKEVLPVEELHFSYDPDNKWACRIRDIYRAGMKRWQGNVVMGMTDLGGILDVLATFRTSENLLFDLYDSPEEIDRLVRELQACWLASYYDFTGELKGSRGYSDWGTILCEEPTYMLQSDFCYMIGPEMFERFVFPELDSTAAKLTNPFYHLDGIGELTHLDRLLTSEHIKGIQWVPGSGTPDSMDWSEVYAKISASGKKLQVYYDMEKSMDDVLAAIERPDDLVKMQFSYPISQKKEKLEKLCKYGVEL